MRKLLFIIPCLVFITEVAQAQRHSWWKRSRLSSFTAAVTIDPVNSGVVYKLTVSPSTEATLSIITTLPRTTVTFEENFTGSYDFKRQIATFTDVRYDDLVRIRTRRNGREHIITHLLLETNVERYKSRGIYGFNRSKQLLYFVSRWNKDDDDEITFSRSQVRYNYKKLINGKSDIWSSHARSYVFSNKNGLLSNERASVFYMYDSYSKRAGVVSATYSFNKDVNDGVPSSHLSYQTIDHEIFSEHLASSSESGQKAAAFFRYTEKLASMRNPEDLNFLMNIVEARYFDDEQSLKFGVAPKYRVYYSVVTQDAQAELIPLGGTIGFDKRFIARGEVDFLSDSNSADIDDVIIQWPYSLYYRNALSALGVDASNFSLRIDPNTGEYAFVVFLDADYAAISSDEFIENTVDGGEPTQFIFDGETLELTISENGLLEFSVL